MNNENLKQLKAECEALAKKIEKLEAGRWPQVGDKYYLIGDEGDIFSAYWGFSELDIARKRFGNIFRTREQAEAEVMRRKTIVKMRGYNNGLEPDWCNGDQTFGVITYDHLAGHLCSCMDGRFQGAAQVYFERISDAQRCIDEMGDEIKKWVFGVK